MLTPSNRRAALFDLVVGSVSAGVIRKSPVLVVPIRSEGYGDVEQEVCSRVRDLPT